MKTGCVKIEKSLLVDFQKTIGVFLSLYKDAKRVSKHYNGDKEKFDFAMCRLQTTISTIHLIEEGFIDEIY